VFDRDLASAAERRARLAHMTALVTGFLTNTRPGEMPARGRRRAGLVPAGARD
jgi:hypothetical protein